MEKWVENSNKLKTNKRQFHGAKVKHVSIVIGPIVQVTHILM